MELTSEQAAYLAGVIDGEGHLAIRKFVRQYAANTYTFQAKVTNTNLAWLEGLQQWIGGKIYRTDSKKRRNRRPCYDLRLDGGEARLMLAQIQPYLRLKQRHGVLLLRYFDLAARRRESNLPGKKSDPALVAEIESMFQEIKSYNLRGLVQDWATTPKRNRECQMDGCHHPHMAKGYCKTHYKKFIERGGPAWHEANCARCDKPFVSKRSDARFCSHDCADLDYKRRTRHPSSEPV